MNETLLNKARLNVVSLNKVLINGAVERHGSSAGGGGAPSKYIRFADPAVEAVLMANRVSSDGVGITKEDAAKVRSIGTWFKGNKKITSFDEFKYFTGVKNLGSSNSTSQAAFYECKSLRTIILPTSVTLINAPSFLGCTSLTSVGGLDNVTNISPAFANCTSLAQDIVMPALKAMNTGRCFANCPIKSFTAPKLSSLPIGLQVSGTIWGVFHNCTELREVNIDWQNMSSIGRNAFYNCTSLSFDELNLPNLTSLGMNAFYGVKIKKLNLGKVSTLPSSMDSFQNYGDKSVLEDITIPNTITRIPYSSFYGYSSLNTIHIDWAKIKVLEDSAFYNCSSLVLDELNLPNIETFGANALYNVKVRRLVLGGTLSSLPYGNSSAAGKNYYGDISVLEELVIPSSVTIIPPYFLAGYQLVKEVNLENITEISDNGFMSSYIESAVLPNIVKMGYSDFKDNSAIRLIDLGPNLTGSLSYTFNQCKELATLIMRATTPPTADANTFSGTKLSSGVIYVPDASVEAYKTATNWSAFASQIRPISEYNG
jgi:hypothetical protein